MLLTDDAQVCGDRPLLACGNTTACLDLINN